MCNILYPCSCSPAYLDNVSYFAAGAESSDQLSQPTLPTAGDMPLPPPHSAGELSFPAFTHIQILAAVVFCCVVLTLFFASKIRTRRNVLSSRTISHPTEELLDDTPPDTSAKLNGRAAPFPSFPPPVGCVPLPLSPHDRHATFYPTSGMLAAKALRSRNNLPCEAQEHQNPWGRSSHPFGGPVNPLEGGGITIKYDGDQFFEDPDLNSIWRRRTIEFG